MTAAILAYHSLDDSGSVISTPPRVFARHMRELHASGRRVVPLKDLRQVMNAEPVVAITFDDGFRSVYEHALPLLASYGFPATVFLVSDYVGHANDWPSQPAGIPTFPLLEWAHVREMSAAGIDFGCHTRTHPFLTSLRARETEDELVRSKALIEDAVGRAVVSLAYPYGAYDRTVRDLAASHYRIACSTTLGYARAESDPLGMERVDMYYLRRPGMVARLFGRSVGGYLRARGWGRAVRARLASRGQSAAPFGFAEERR